MSNRVVSGQPAANGHCSVLVLDASSESVRLAHQALLPLGAHLTVARSVSALREALNAGLHYDRLVLNLTGDLSDSAVADQLGQAGYRGPILVIFDPSVSEPPVDLGQLSTVALVRRPAPQDLGDLLRRFVSRPRATAGDGRDAGRGRPQTVQTAHGLVGTSRPMREILQRIEKIAASDANACIVGESGTGKELIARAIHYCSKRNERPFITLDCTTIPEGLMESQLFGHVKGAFTGAIENRDGVFSLAHTGTLFLDELCELSLPLQAKLLRVIQSREFFKVGGTKPIVANVRLITATNKDLKSAVDARIFREDLYYRVAILMIRVPSLRERREDIPLLVSHFLKKFASAYGKPVHGVSPSALERMIAAPWPGNVRQLENTLEQAVVLAEDDILGERDIFTEDIRRPLSRRARPEVEPGRVAPLREVERQHILSTLEVVGGNRTEAARVLGISLRCLQYRLKSYLEDGRDTVATGGPASTLYTNHRLSG